MSAEINLSSDSFTNLEFEIPLAVLGETNYDRVRKAILKLQSRYITLIDDKNLKELERITPFPKVKIKNGIIKLTMLADIVPYFLELKKGFTKYELAAALSLSSVYSQKLYEHFSRWKDKGKWIIQIADLKTLLNAENYRYSDFKRRCLENSLEEINEKTDLNVSCEAEKNGKSVFAIDFKISIKAKKELEEAKEGFKEDFAILSNMKPSEVSTHVHHMLHDYTFTKQQHDLIISDPKLFSSFVELDLKVRNGLVLVRTSPTAYLASILFKKKPAKKPATPKKI